MNLITKMISLLCFILFCSWATASFGSELGIAEKRVVNLFIQEDLNGSRLDSEKYMNVRSLTSWENEPAWDNLFIVEKATIKDVSRGKASTLVNVEYVLRGHHNGMEIADLRCQTEEKDFQVKKVQGRYKITSPIFPPHVSLKTAISHFKFLAETSDNIYEATKYKALISDLQKLSGCNEAR